MSKFFEKVLKIGFSYKKNVISAAIMNGNMKKMADVEKLRRILSFL